MEKQSTGDDARPLFADCVLGIAGGEETAPEVIFDIGMFDGEDTAYYVERGFSVVAVDANPLLCAKAEKRFAEEIARGKITIVNEGIVNEGIFESSDELDFWVSDHLDWSSFDRLNATKAGATAQAIRVPTVRFAELLGRYPTARHIKIDIEGMDSSCLRALAECERRPHSLSFEAHPDAIADVSFLASLGYDAFKCVRQNDWHEITPDNVRRQTAFQKALMLMHLRGLRPLGGLIERVHYRRRPIAGRMFRIGSSGPLGWELPGPWLSEAQLIGVWGSIWNTVESVGADRYFGVGEWFDVHAAITSALPDATLTR